MKSLATVDLDAAPGLVEQLRQAGITCETRSVTEESGGVATELVVEDSVYDAACDVVDAWSEDQSSKARMICPKCRASSLERVPHDSVEVHFKCRDCGCEVLAQA